MVIQSESKQAVPPETLEVAKLAKLAAAQLPILSGEVRAAALNRIAEKLDANQDQIEAANKLDLKEADALLKKGEISQASLGRLKFDKDKLKVVVEGIRQLAKSPDPIGQPTWGMLLDEGLELYRINCPIGVVAVIFESRPDALPQIVSLCVRTANACILKGGREAKHSNRILFDLINDALKEAGMPANAVALLETRTAVDELLHANGLVDLIIPRGSNQLVSHIQNNTSIPVLGHSEGICHIYVDQSANFEKAKRVVRDAKVQYPTACNSVETLLVHKDIAGQLLPDLVKQLQADKVEVRADQESAKILSDFKLLPAHDADWSTEYGDLVLSIKMVASIDEAIQHINRFGSHHTESIVTEDQIAFDKFFAAVDSAGVFLNASTRFADGYRYGFGAEVGISTGKLHPRGPVGLEGLITYKYKLLGNGHVVSDYAGPTAKTFLHKRLPTD